MIWKSKKLYHIGTFVFYNYFDIKGISEHLWQRNVEIISNIYIRVSDE